MKRPILTPNPGPSQPKPRRSATLRWLVIGYGLTVFFWLGPEDDHIWPVILLGFIGALLGVVAWLQGRKFNLFWLPLTTSLLGVGVGIGTSVITVVLMLFKNARHAHAFPDFSAPLMGEILARVPAWGVAGALAGLGCGLLWLAVSNGRHKTKPPLK